MSAYPSGLPSPLVEDYSVDTRYGVSAVTFERGNTRQRRNASKLRQVFQLTVILTPQQLWTWQSWANAYGYDWHLLDLVNSYSGGVGSVPLSHYVRYISDISIQLVGANNFRVTVQAEMDIDRLPIGIVTPSGNVIIGGTPAAPSNSNSIQAGTPASPSTDFIIAGSPGLNA